MKRLVISGALFSVPFAVWALIVIAVDPFNYFGISPLVEERIKLNTSYRLHYPIWKAVEFNRRPLPNIILGDSRGDHIDTRLVEKMTGERYYNFSYGGGTVPEIVDTFWFAAARTRLKNVYIGINFNLYNAFNSMNRFPEAEAIINNPARYFIHRSVLRGIGSNLYVRFVDDQFRVGDPPMDRDAFWNYQLSVIAAYYYKLYRYPEQYRGSLQKIADYCEKEGIRLVFVVYPTHVDLQKRVSDFKLDGAQRRFREDLKNLGACVIDLDTPSPITQRRANFSDPFHYNSKCMEQVVKLVWGRKAGAHCGEATEVRGDPSGSGEAGLRIVPVNGPGSGR